MAGIIAPFFKSGLKIIWKFRIKLHPFPGGWMLKTQGFCMQRLPGEYFKTIFNKLFIFCNKIASEFNILVYWIVRETSKSDWQTNLRHNWQFSIFLPLRKVCSPNKIKILPTKASSTNISDREKNLSNTSTKSVLILIHSCELDFFSG